MAVTSTKGLAIYLEKGTAVAEELSPASITAGKDPVITFDATGKTVAIGDTITVGKSGIAALDGKTWVITAYDASTATAAEATLGGADATTGTLDTANAEFGHLKATDFVKLCLSGVDISAGSSSTIDVSTFCGPAALPGNPTAGTFTFSGYTDISDSGYIELLAAEADGQQRVIKIDVPNQGYMVADTIIGSVVWDLPLEGSSGYSFNASQSSAMRHLF
ncbi:hypothetical protein [Vibrio breoganii]|uniref:hypothetical protein n=1 Tax=Vibrio breoganii TaxID=553239 RepID=UPI000C81A70D|nr:hypothetical protein [Vibrio breoganii]PMK30664.1 hypothetical protein BCU03_09620 [Vibrio breoganii]